MLTRRVRFISSQLQTIRLFSNKQTDFGFSYVEEKEKERLVRDVFSKVAKKYDIMNDFMSVGIHRLWKDDFVDSIGFKQASQIKSATSQDYIPRHLDVAGGTGDIAFRSAKQISQYYSESIQKLLQNENNILANQVDLEKNIVVCDINPDMLSVGKLRSGEVLGPDLNKFVGFVEGNAEKLPFADESFDVYTIAFGLRNVTNKDVALSEAFRVLKRGGRIMILEFSHLVHPLLQYGYDQYSFNVIPELGRLVANDRDSYQYLVESIRKFPKQDELVAMLNTAGFTYSSYRNMSLGIVALHSGFKI